jgi:hypothetical protein
MSADSKNFRMSFLPLLLVGRHYFAASAFC